MQVILNFLGSMLSGLIAFFTSKWSVLWLVIINPVLGLIVFIIWLISTVQTYFNEMMVLGSSGGSAVVLNVGTVLGLLNYLVPLDAIFISCSWLLSLYVACLLYRFVKSFIPTLS